MIRIDVAGNISKRFSASGIRFARFSGACPRWNIFQAFPTPGLIRLQLSRMPDGAVYFCLARTIQQDGQGFHAMPRIHAIGLGCRVEHAAQLVYADGLDLKKPTPRPRWASPAASAIAPTASSAPSPRCAPNCCSTRTCAASRSTPSRAPSALLEAPLPLTGVDQSAALSEALEMW